MVPFLHCKKKMKQKKQFDIWIKQQQIKKERRKKQSVFLFNTTRKKKARISLFLYEKIHLIFYATFLFFFLFESKQFSYWFKNFFLFLTFYLAFPSNILRNSFIRLTPRKTMNKNSVFSIIFYCLNWYNKEKRKNNEES